MINDRELFKVLNAIAQLKSINPVLFNKACGYIDGLFQVAEIKKKKMNLNAL